MATEQIDGGVIEIDGDRLPIAVRINPRARRLIMRLDRERTVQVTCPSNRYVSEALRMVETRQDWLREQLTTTPKARPFLPGLELPILGESFLIERAPDPTAAARLEEGKLTVGGRDERSISRRVESLIRSLARDECMTQASGFAAQLSVDIADVTVRQMSSRWGSCSAQGHLCFNWRLAFAPKRVLTYVVAHEVAHRIHMDHSAEFWRVVESLDPDYECATQWLKKFGASLHAYGLMPASSLARSD